MNREEETEKIAKALAGHIVHAFSQLLDLYLQEEKPGSETSQDRDFNVLAWETIEGGSKGPFQRTKLSDNGELSKADRFLELQKLIEQHNGFVHHAGFTYWFDNKDPNVIDRRSKAKSE